MFAEYVQYIETHHYKIVQEVWITSPEELKFYLIVDRTLKRYNVYILPYYAEGTIPSDAKTIVKLHMPVDLETAQTYFSAFNLTEDNYGF